MRLKQHIGPYGITKLCAFLRHNNATMGGSFPLQSAILENFETYDIDIFFRYAKGPPVACAVPLFARKLLCKCEHCNSVGELLHADFVAAIQKRHTFATEVNTQPKDDAYLLNRICHITECATNRLDVKLQFICMRPQPKWQTPESSITETLTREFDLSFCAVFFDGWRMHVHADALTRRGVWRHNTIAYGNTDAARFCRTLRARVAKYKNRGFTVINDPSKQPTGYQAVVERVNQFRVDFENRMKKWRRTQRGRS